jgi:acyl-CoA thioester hydrolase
VTQRFVLPIRVYYEDTDASGVVYHSRYLNFMERARTEWLRALGFEQHRLAAREGVVFAVHRAEVDFLRPARFDELLSVSAEIGERHRASLSFHQEIRRGGDDLLLCRARIRVACLEAARFRPCPLPPGLMREILHER